LDELDNNRRSMDCAVLKFVLLSALGDATKSHCRSIKTLGWWVPRLMGSSRATLHPKPDAIRIVC